MASRFTAVVVHPGHTSKNKLPQILISGVIVGFLLVCLLKLSPAEKSSILEYPGSGDVEGYDFAVKAASSIDDGSYFNISSIPPISNDILQEVKRAEAEQDKESQMNAAFTTGKVVLPDKDTKGSVTSKKTPKASQLSLTKQIQDESIKRLTQKAKSVQALSLEDNSKILRSVDKVSSRIQSPTVYSIKHIIHQEHSQQLKSKPHAVKAKAPRPL